MVEGSDPKKSIEQWLRETAPQEFQLVEELARKLKTDVRSAFLMRLSHIRESNRDLYEKIKAARPDLLTLDDVTLTFDLRKEGLGRIYQDTDGTTQAEGYLKEIVRLGPEGEFILSKVVKGHNTEYINKIVDRFIAPKLAFGIVSIPSSSGIENMNGSLDPTTTALIALRQYAQAKTFSDKEADEELRQRATLSFAHSIQTSLTLEQAILRLNELRTNVRSNEQANIGHSESPFGVLYEALDTLEGMVRDWDRFKKPIVKKSGPIDRRQTVFPQLHQYLRGACVLDSNSILLKDDTSGGKTGSICMPYFLLSDKMRRSGSKRKPRMLVIAPSQPASSVWNDKEINDNYCKWLERENETIVRLKRESLNADLRSIRNGGIAVLGAGALSYAKSKHSPLQENPYIKRLLEEEPFDIIVVDEVQLSKNPGSRRSKGVLSLARHNKDAYVVVASATPAEKNINDLRTTMYLLDRRRMPDPRGLDLFRDLNAAREIMRRRSFQLSVNEIKVINGMPEYQEEKHLLEMTPEETQSYFNLWTQLSRSCEDDAKSMPRAMHGMFHRLFPAKMRWLKQYLSSDAVREENNKKMVFYTRYRSHVDAIQKLLESQGISCLALTGTTNADEREQMLETKFRKGDVQALVTTQLAMDVGVKIISYNNHPIDVLFVEPPRSFGSFKQLKGRQIRTVQEGKVTIHRLTATSETLYHHVRSHLNDLVKEFPIVLPKSEDALRNIGRTLDELAYSVIDNMERIDQSLFDRMSVEDISTLAQNAYAVGNYGLNINDEILKLVIIDSQHRVATQFFETHNGIDYHKLKDAQERGNAWKHVVSCYNHLWNFSASRYTLDFLKEIVEKMEQKNMRIGKGRYQRSFVDLGAGAAYATRVFQRPFINVDMDPLMLAEGKKAVRPLMDADPIRYAGMNDSMYWIQKDIQDTGIPSASVDIAIASYVMQYQAQRYDAKKNVALRQLEDSLIEANRILAPEGHLFITLPRSVKEDSIKQLIRRFTKENPSYGFVATELTGHYGPQRRRELQGASLVNRSLGTGGSARGFHLVVLKKVRTHDGSYQGKYQDYALFPSKKIKLMLGKYREYMAKGNVPRGRGGRYEIYDMYQRSDNKPLDHIIEELE